MTIEFLNPEDVTPEIISKESEFWNDELQKSGKPENIINKMVEGRIEKFYAESCLLEQHYIKDLS